ncbi:MAG: hypothetical protein KC964_22835 [Candidatus Omnitrophica bacterium]|nr:hypothetical protein [Candidatus Omnitrophota bacterium]
MVENSESNDRLMAAYEAGRRVGMGVSAVALGCVTFLSLLGVEKALLTIVLGILACKGSPPAPFARKLGLVSIALGVVFLVTAAVLLVTFHQEFAEFVKLLQTLS